MDLTETFLAIRFVLMLVINSVLLVFFKGR